MRAWKWAVAVVFVAGLAGLVGRASAQEPRYAAVDANNEGSLQVVWDASKDGASEKAVSACNRVSKSCSGTASYTNEPKDVFAYMCCTRPRLGCSIGVGEDRTAAHPAAPGMQHRRGRRPHGRARHGAQDVLGRGLFAMHREAVPVGRERQEIELIDLRRVSMDHNLAASCPAQAGHPVITAA